MPNAFIHHKNIEIITPTMAYYKLRGQFFIRIQQSKRGQREQVRTSVSAIFLLKYNVKSTPG